MTSGIRQDDRDGSRLGELTIRAVILVGLVTTLIMVGLPAAWALAAAH